MFVMQRFRALRARLLTAVTKMPQARFEAARARQPALASLDGVPALLRVMRDQRLSTYPRRDAITQALICEHRAAEHPLWGTLLLVAYYPMLARLRQRLVCEKAAVEDLDQIVIECFLDALSELPRWALKDRTAMRLRQHTTRAAIRQLQRQAEAARTMAIESCEANHDRTDMSPIAERLQEQHPAETTAAHFVDLAVLLERAAETGVADHKLAVVATTVLRGESLRSISALVVPADDDLRERAFQRLKRMRTRTVRTLEGLAKEEPKLQTPALLSSKSCPESVCPSCNSSNNQS